MHRRRERLAFPARKANPYQVEHDDLFASIRNGTPINEAENGATSTMTSILGRMATYSGKVVKWDEAINSPISLMPKDFSFEATPLVLPGPDGMYPRRAWRDQGGLTVLRRFVRFVA